MFSSSPVAAAVLADRPLMAVTVAEKTSTPTTAAITRGLVVATAAHCSTPTSSPPAMAVSSAVPLPQSTAAVVVAAWEPPAKRCRKALHAPLSSTWMDSTPAAFEWSSGSHSPVSTGSASSRSTASLPSPPRSDSYASIPLDRRSSLPLFPLVASPVNRTPRQLPLRLSSAPVQSRTLSSSRAQGGNLHTRLQQHPAIQLIQQRLNAELSPTSGDEEEDDESSEAADEEADHAPSTSPFPSQSTGVSTAPISAAGGAVLAPLSGRHAESAYHPLVVPLTAHSSSFSNSRSAFSPSMYPAAHPASDAAAVQALLPPLLAAFPHSSSSSSSFPYSSTFVPRDVAPDTSVGFVARSLPHPVYEEPSWEAEYPPAALSVDEPWQEWLDFEQPPLARHSLDEDVDECSLY